MFLRFYLIFAALILAVVVAIIGCNNEKQKQNPEPIKAAKDEKESKTMILTECNFEKHTERGVALVDFWAPWCGPCNMLSPTIEEVAKVMEGKVLVGKVNTDEEQSLAANYKVSAIPALFFFKDGEVKETLMGIQSKEKIIEKLEELLDE